MWNYRNAHGVFTWDWLLRSHFLFTSLGRFKTILWWVVAFFFFPCFPSTSFQREKRGLSGEEKKRLVMWKLQGYLVCICLFIIRLPGQISPDLLLWSQGESWSHCICDSGQSKCWARISPFGLLVTAACFLQMEIKIKFISFLGKHSKWIFLINNKY